jgi:MoaA/NifB/PqqE/SkfB family radical SAM enzyme
MFSPDDLKMMARAFPVFSDLSDEDLDTVMTRVTPWLGQENATAKGQNFMAGLMKNLNDNPTFIKWCLRLLLELSDPSIHAFYKNIVLGTVLDRLGTIDAFKKEHGFVPPVTMVINPTMRCNIRCRGCYAYNFEKQGDMDYALLRKVLREARDIGLRFITLSGGEPLLYRHVYRMFEEFSDMNFLMYTNGVLIDDKVGERLAACGNVMPAISVEGYEAETDQRRGKGIFAKTLEAMEVMREKGLLFGISCTPTSINSDIMCTEEFYDFWMEQGIFFVWLFTYVPVGRDPDLSLMATPEQRDRLRRVTTAYRVKRPLFLADFWNDGPCVCGCLSAARYLYITNDGNVQPCTFVHFYTHNVRDHSLVEILKSPFFRAVRDAQPYSENLLRPCKILDNPQVLRRIIKETGARPSYEGADQIIRNPEVMTFLDRYAMEHKKLADAAWLNDLDGGRNVLIPFLGRRNLWDFYAWRMKNAPRDIQKEDEMYYKKDIQASME